MSDEIPSEALVQNALAETAKSMTLRDPDKLDEPSPVDGLPRFRPQPTRVPVEDLRKARSQQPSEPSQVATLTAQVAQLTALVSQLAGSGTTTPTPKTPTMAFRPERVVYTVPPGHPAFGKGPQTETSPPVKKGRGRPIGTTKTAMAARKKALEVNQQLVADTEALKVPLPPLLKLAPSRPTPESPKSESCLVSAIPLPTTADRSAVVQAIEALPHGLFNALLAEVKHQLSANDSYKLFRKIMRRTGTWEPDRMPPWMLEQLSIRMDHLLSNPHFVRQVVAGCLCIEPATAGTKVHYWLVNLAGWLAWASITECV